jgi:hypothetical protein
MVAGFDLCFLFRRDELLQAEEIALNLGERSVPLWLPFATVH